MRDKEEDEDRHTRNCVGKKYRRHAGGCSCRDDVLRQLLRRSWKLAWTASNRSVTLTPSHNPNDDFDLSTACREDTIDLST